MSVLSSSSVVGTVKKSIKRAESKQKVVDRLLETLKIPEAEKKGHVSVVFGAVKKRRRGAEG